MAGFADVPGTEIIVFIQKTVFQNPRIANDHSNRANTHVIAIDGNFDDAQTDVKRMFNDVDLREIVGSSYAILITNSMNVGRLVPQVVYYVYAYAQLVRQVISKTEIR